MAVLTIISNPLDGTIYSDGHAGTGGYPAARDGSNLPGGGLGPDTTSPGASVGQQVSSGTSYTCNEGFLMFDTSPLRTLGVPVDATLTLAQFVNDSPQDFTVEVRLYNWSAGGLLYADWVLPTAMAALPLLATWPSSAFLAFGALARFDNNGTALRDNLNVTGSTCMLLNSDRHRLGLAPTINEKVDFMSGEGAFGLAAAKLEVTYAPYGRWGGISR